MESYFEYVLEARSSLKYRPVDEDCTPATDEAHLWGALLPLPQAHLYCEDPLVEGATFVPERMFKVDFLFWSGKQLIAVEIDGSSHIGSETHIIKDRLLQRSGVHVVHITNREVFEFGTKIIRKLLPAPVWRFNLSKWPRSPWGDSGDYEFDPDDDIPF